ncbi:MAG: ATP-binding protein [Planctomycetota bacterium]
MDVQRSPEEARDHAEKRLRKNIETVHFSGNELSARNRQFLCAFQSRLDALDELVEVTAKRAADTVAEHEGQDAVHLNLDGRSYGTLSPRALYKMDAASAELRHSIAQAALGSLRMLAQQLPEKHQDAVFVQKLVSAFEHVQGVRAQTTSYFDYLVSPGLTVRSILPEVERKVNAALNELANAAESSSWEPDSADWAEAFSERVVQAIDSILDVFMNLRERLDLVRVSARRIAEEVCELGRSFAVQQNVSLNCGCKSSEPWREESAGNEDGRYRIFADRDALMNAFGELVRNACRHAFPVTHQGRKEVNVTVRNLPEDDAVTISVKDNGCGMERKDIAALGSGISQSGGGYGFRMVRRVIEAEHLGKLTVESTPGKGTCIEARLPVHLVVNGEG